VLSQHLREQYAADGRVEVIGDRRRATAAEIPLETNLRRGERRILDRRSGGHGDRRQAQRRWMLAPSQQAFWVTEGFFMVRRNPDAPPPWPRPPDPTPPDVAASRSPAGRVGARSRRCTYRRRHLPMRSTSTGCDGGPRRS